MIKEPKVPLSLRVHPELKADIENEAISANLTTSKYMEYILHQRHHVPVEVDEDVNAEWEELYNELNEEKRELEKEVEESDEAIIELARENRQLKKDLEKQSEQLGSLESEYDQLQGQKVNNAGIQFNEEEESLFDEILKKLNNVYPELSQEQLLLACLRTTLKNEKSYLFIHQIGANI